MQEENRLNVVMKHFVQKNIRAFVCDFILWMIVENQRQGHAIFMAFFT